MFLFLVYQNANNSGILLRWTKGFDFPGVIGQDILQLLQYQIDLRNLPVQVIALINNAAKTIICRSYSLPVHYTRTSLGTILGIDTNGIYPESSQSLINRSTGVSTSRRAISLSASSQVLSTTISWFSQAPSIVLK